ncbi:Uncharacterized protein Fot_57252 [Forsythia ovata]|uniref:Uncharacterized protein n=1 Tax=Forsythia ovata TaxID=205694 RepID=A0ABD1NW47_9LAMI
MAQAMSAVAMSAVIQISKLKKKKFQLAHFPSHFSRGHSILTQFQICPKSPLSPPPPFSTLVASGRAALLKLRPRRFCSSGRCPFVASLTAHQFAKVSLGPTPAAANIYSRI